MKPQVYVVERMDRMKWDKGKSVLKVVKVLVCWFLSAYMAKSGVLPIAPEQADMATGIGTAVLYGADNAAKHSGTKGNIFGALESLPLVGPLVKPLTALLK